MKQFGKIIIMNLFACLITSCQSQPQSAIRLNDLKGNVKTTTSIQYSFDTDEDGNEVKKIKRKEYKQYNQEGNIEEEHEYDERDDLKVKYTIQYKKGREASRHTYTKNRVISYLHPEELIGKTRSIYDKKGNMVELLTYYSTGKIYAQTIMKYDSIDNKIHEKQTSVLFKDTIEHHYKYKNRLLIETTSYRNEKQQSWVRIVYNEQGKVKEEERLNESGELIERTAFEYNEKGYRVKESTYSGSGELLMANEISLEYDGYDNVVKRVSYQVGKPVAEELITILYY